MNLRIRKYRKGWVVEIQKTKGFIFKTKYWIHFISVAGIESMPWYFHSEESAMREMLNKIKWDTIRNSK